MSNQKLGKSNWLHILSQAIGNYVEEGGGVVLSASVEGEVLVQFTAVTLADKRLHPKFRRLEKRVVETAVCNKPPDQ